MTFEQRPGGQQPRQHVSARVPESIGAGVFASATVVMATGQELVLDFLQTLVQPHQVVSRVIVPWPTVPQLIVALRQNLEKFDNRFRQPMVVEGQQKVVEASLVDQDPVVDETVEAQSRDADEDEKANPGEISNADESKEAPVEASRQPIAQEGQGVAVPARQTGETNPRPVQKPADDMPKGTRQVAAKSFYEDLKLDDEILRGHYSNGAMINHTEFEFKIDFLTTLAPHPIVTARIFLSEPQVRRLLMSIEENESRRRRG